MREKFIDRKYAVSEDGIKYEIFYYILSEDRVDDGVERESFGVKIEMREEGNPEKRRSCASVTDITVNQDRIYDIINLLARNLVTPVGLRDVIDDCILY